MVNRIDLNFLKSNKETISFVLKDSLFLILDKSDLEDISVFKKDFSNAFEKDESFYYLPSNVIIDSSLEIFLKEKRSNVIKLVKNKKPFLINNDKKFSFYYYSCFLFHEKDETLIVKTKGIKSFDITKYLTLPFVRTEDIETKNVNQIITVESKQFLSDVSNIELKVTETDENGLVIESYFRNGKLTTVYRFINDVFHNDNKNQEPSLTYYYENGVKKHEEWYKNGELHREDDKPAQISYYKSGKKENEVWFKDGEKYRDGDKPTRIQYYENGNKKTEKWIRFKMLYRENKKGKQFEPSIIFYYENGNKKEQMWWRNNKLYRDDDKPVIIQYHENEIKKREEWIVNDKERDIDNKRFVINYDENEQRI